MRIALVSYEFAAVAKRGGIGTYMANLADMLAARGHEVEVFAGADATQEVRMENGVRLFVVGCPIRGDFAEKILPIFAARQKEKPFDVIEGAEFLAESASIAEAFPDVPLVLKLHTPSALISLIDGGELSWKAKARFMLGGLMRGKLHRPYWWHDPANDYEKRNLVTADEVTSPSVAMVEKLMGPWQLDPAKVTVIPNVFVPHPALLAIAPDTASRVIAFVGRLELRKGVVDLGAAIPTVLARYPDVRFRFIGGSLPHPETGQDLRAMIQDRIGDTDRVEFIPGLPYDQLIEQYADVDLCVFPSLWENFPNVCLEAMSAARGIVASSSGGMAEMITHGITGLLAPPHDPAALAEAIGTLLDDPASRARMGRAARAVVLERYSHDAIAPLQECSYRRAIAVSTGKADAT